MIDIVDATDVSWLEALSRLKHDVHHLPGWVTAEAAHRGWTAAAALSTGGQCDVVIPLLRRELGDGAWDAVSPYGYAGPIFSDDVDDDVRAAALSDVVEALGAAGCVSVFLRTHPLLEGQDIRQGELVSDAVTLVVDLDASDADRLARMRSGHRYDIRRARREGTTIEIGPVDDRLDDFVDIYTATMERLGAEDFYNFDRQYFVELADQLGDHLILVTAHHGDSIDAASMFTVSKSANTIGYHLSGSRPSASSNRPVKLMLVDAMNWAAEHGLRWMNLGGGVGSARDSLYEFKRGFGAEEHAYRTFGLITNTREYIKRMSEIDNPAERFFPAYRAGEVTRISQVSVL